MSEEKKSVFDGLRDEALDQGAHMLASETGKGIRTFIERSISPAQLQSLVGNGLPKIVANLAAFIVRAVLPNTPNTERLRNVITEVLDEAVADLGTGRSAHAPTPHVVGDSASSSSRGGYIPRPIVDPILALTTELAEKIIDFIDQIYQDSARGGEREAERILAWLRQLGPVELGTFAVLSDENKWSYWKAQEDPKERARIANEAEEAVRAVVARATLAWSAFETWCATRASTQELRANVLLNNLAERREYLERLRGKRDYTKGPHFWDRFAFWRL